MSDDEFAAVVESADSAAATHPWDHQIAGEILSPDPADADRDALADAFRLGVPLFRPGSGDRFGPVPNIVDNTRVLRPIGETPAGVCEVWSRAATRARTPRLRARLHDLLFECRYGQVGNHAIDAAKAYLEEDTPDRPPDLHLVDALGRALHLAKITRQSVLVTECREALVMAATRGLTDPEEKPGVFLALADTLVQDRPVDPRVDDLLAQARQQYASNAFIVERIIRLQRSRSQDDQGREALDRELVNLWLTEAGLRDPLVALMFREKAAGLARSLGLPDLADQAILAMQAADPVQLPLVRVDIPAPFTNEEVEEYIESLIGPDWWESILRVVANTPPTGEAESNCGLAADLAKASPLLAHTAQVRLGGDGLPRYTASTDDDRADDQLTRVELQSLRLSGWLLAEVLRRSGDRFAPSKSHIADCLEAVGCSAVTAIAIGRALERFYDGDHEGAVYTALPLIERICRDLLLAVDAPLYRVQRAKSPGTYPGLGALLSALADRGLDPSWHRFLRTFLASSNGMNVRNEAMHGFLAEIDPTVASLTMIALLHVATLRPATENGPASESSPPA